MDGYSQVNLLIGSSCDMHCPYCLQHDGRSLADRKADPEEFAEKFAKFLRGRTVGKVMLWGGEPMLYWKRIRAVYEALHRAGARIGYYVFTTNGRSLTDDYIEFANSHPDLRTVVSWHGGGFSDDQLERIFRLKTCTLSEIISHYRLDLWDFRNWYWELQERFRKGVIVCAHYLRATDGCGEDWYMTREDVDAFFGHVERDILPMAAWGDEWAGRQLSQLLYDRDRRLPQPVGAMCVRPDRLSVDLHGNEYLCHHDFAATNVIGNVFRGIPIVPEESLRETQKYWKSDRCRKCPEDVRLYCRGGCYLSKTHDIDCYLAKRRGKTLRLVERELGKR